MRSVVTVLCSAALLIGVSAADAQVARRRFDPEDLDLEEPGVVHADLQVGMVRGAQAGRWLIPDFGIDVGVAEDVELGLDGVISLEGTPQRPWAADHRAGDNLWLSSKLGLYESGTRTHRVWTAGIQVGPKLPVAPDAHGIGYEGIALLAYTRGQIHVIGNLGGFVDPGGAISSGRPAGIESGLDLMAGIGSGKRWRFIADLSGVYSLTGAPTQLQSTFGPQVSITSWLDVSPQALVGFLRDSDRVGFLVVVSPRWSPPSDRSR